MSLRPSNATYFLSLLDTYCGSHLITTSAWQLEGVPSFHPDAMLVLGSIWFYEANPAFGIANTLVQEMNTNIWYDLKHISPHCPEHLRRETPDEQRWKDLPWHSRIEKGCNEIQKDNKALGPLGIKKYAFIAVACFSRFSPYLYLFTIVMTFHLSLLGTLGLGNSWVKLPPRNNNGKKSGILCCVHVVHVLFRNKSKKALANVTAMSNFWRVDCAGYIA